MSTFIWADAEHRQYKVHLRSLDSMNVWWAPMKRNSASHTYTRNKANTDALTPALGQAERLSRCPEF
jgi:hypothetical protein